MLRLRLDLTAFKTQPKEIFWRLERVGILHKTVEQYVGHLLREYGIDSVQPMVYLDGTYLPGTESPFIFRDGDVLRILPRNVVDKNSSVKGIPESFPCTASKSTVVFETPVGVRENGDATHPEQEESETLECATESAETSELLDPTDISESGAPMPKKRKRGKRPNRLRSKRVSFDVLADENGGDDKTPHLESTPFRNRVSNDAAPEAQNGSSVETRSGCYVTALEDTSGVSRQSKTPMKTTTARKEKKIQSGVGYYLNLLGSGDSSLAAGSSADSVASPDTRYLKPGPSNCSDSQRNGEGSRNTHDQSRKDGSLLAALPPNSKVSCVIGMFDVKTAGIQRYSDVTLEILCNYPEKKSSTVRLIEGYLPSHVSGSEFKVDWGMISSVNTL